MLFILLSSSLAHYINFDIGSQFVRGAKIWASGTPSMVSNRQGSTITPNSVSFKTKDVPDGHLKADNISNLQVKYGNPSIQNLKYNPSTGSPYLGYLLGRNNTDGIEIPKIATSSELFSLLIQDLLSSKEFIGYEGVSFTIPAYYTYNQRKEIMRAIYIANIPFLGLFDDFHAISYAYAHKNLDRFSGKNHSVLFIDVGASHASAFRVDFYLNETGYIANLTSYEWSEETGSFAFARALAKEKSISFRKAMKLVQNGRVEAETISNELDELQRIINIALNGEKVDLVQLIGGASKLSLVEEAVKTATQMEISRELAYVDTNALGGALMAQIMATNMEWPVLIIRCPIYTMDVRCKSVSQHYCDKGGKCVKMMKLDDTICNDIVFEADKSEIPIGTDPKIAEFHLDNISKFDHLKGDSINGFLELDPPLPQLVSVDWCLSATLECKPINFSTSVPTEEFESSKDFVNSIISFESRTRKVMEMKANIRVLADELVSNAKGDAIESANKISEKVTKIADESDDIPTLEDTIKQLKELYEEQEKYTADFNPEL